MLRKRRSSSPRQGSGSTALPFPSEWIGGRLTLPVYITEGEPYRPEMLVWIELPTDLVVAHRLLAPGESTSLGDLLLEAMQSPMAGPPRRPERIRVASAALAVEVRAALDDSIPVTVAATPELDVLLSGMLDFQAHGDEPPSYLEGGRVPADVVGELFDAAARLYRAAPWRFATDDQVLELDIPELGIEAACVSIMGSLDQTFGIAIFPSLAAYEEFRDSAEVLALEPLEDLGPLDLGTDERVLLFEPKAELPIEMQREIKAHGWRVAGPRAYPVVYRVDPDAVRRPLDALDVRIVSVCAGALAAFASAHRRNFESLSSESVEESYREGGLEVRLALLPSDTEEVELDDVDELLLEPVVVPAVERVGRNEPCPCGSGKKYKKCHLEADRERESAARQPARKHGVDEDQLFIDLCRYGRDRFPFALDHGTAAFEDVEKALQLAAPWSVFGPHVQGRSIAERYLEERGRRLAPAERAWLERQCAAWLSIWEVTEIEPGVGMTLCDLLTGEARRVREVMGSRALAHREVILARVVDHDDASVLDGAHPRALAPRPAADVVRKVRGHVRCKTHVPIERLRDPELTIYLITRWEEAVEREDAQRALPPVLQNTDGDPLLHTVDHFAFAPDERARIESGLATIEGVELPDPADESPHYVFLRAGNAQNPSWDNTVVGTATLGADKLRAETNSIRRADALRATLERACGTRLRHVAREHADPLSRKAEKPRSSPVPEPLSAEMRAALIEHKQQHYTAWLDHPLPALEGKTPREAIRRAPGRAAVELLLKEIEHTESRSNPDERVDLSAVRRELGLDR